MIIYEYIIYTVQQFFSDICSSIGVNYLENLVSFSPYVATLSILAFVFVIYFTLKITVGVIRWFFRI